MTSRKRFNPIYLIVLFDWMQHLSDMVVRSETINETQSSAMINAPKSDSSIQTVPEECYTTEGQGYLSKSGLRSPMGVNYSQ
jgi:hypothetical protein